MINSQALAHIRSKPDRVYEDLIKAARAAEVPVPMMRIDFVARDANGNVTGGYHGWSRTYVRNFYNTLLGAVSNAPAPSLANYNDGFLTTKDTAGVIRNVTWIDNVGSQPGTTSYFSSVTDAVVGIATVGIVIGTGLVPESFNSFALAAAIAHGNGAGQLSYTAQSATVPSWNGGTRQFTAQMARIYNNNSGSPIVVTEAAMYMRQQLNDSLTNRVFMMWRDLLASPVSVANGGQLTVTYTLVLQYPADVVNEPPYLGNSMIDPMVMQARVSRNWCEESSPRGSPRAWQSTEAWQRQQYRNFKQ